MSCLGLAGRADDKKAVHPVDAMPLRFTDRVLHLLQGLLLLQPVQHLLRARLHPKGQEVAVGLFHERQLIHRHRIHPAFAAPAELQSALNDALANVADALAVQEKVIIGQVNRAIAQIVQLLHFSQDMLRGTAAPFALRKGRDIAVDAGIGAASRSLHGAEFVQGEDRGDVQGQGLDVVDGQAGPVGVRKLIQVLEQRTWGVPNDLRRRDARPDRPLSRDRRGGPSSPAAALRPRRPPTQSMSGQSFRMRSAFMVAKAPPTMMGIFGAAAFSRLASSLAAG